MNWYLENIYVVDVPRHFQEYHYHLTKVGIITIGSKYFGLYCLQLIKF